MPFGGAPSRPPHLIAAGFAASVPTAPLAPPLALPAALGEQLQLVAAVDVRLGVDVLDVRLGRAFGKSQLGAYVGHPAVGADQAGDLELARGEPARPPERFGFRVRVGKSCETGIGCGRVRGVGGFGA